MMIARGCLKGTREAVLDEIESWFKDFNLSLVYWLNRLAGTGKSTIAQTIAERVFADGRFRASFFCSRDFKDRRSLHYIFPTLAFQLAQKYPKFRSILVPLQSNSDIVHDSLYNQMEMLVVEPFQSGFRLGLLKPLTDVFVLHGVEPSAINADIRLFLEHGLSELAKRRGIE